MQERRAVPALTRPRVAAVGLVTAVLVVTADQLTKWWALEQLADGPVDLVWTLRLRLTFNSGAAFSTGEGYTPFLTAAGVVVLLVLVAMTRSVDSRPVAAAFGLMVGGAVGNLTDRLVRDHGGAVVDFVDFQWWPVFNVADAALVIGAVLLVLAEFRRERAERGREAGA